MACLRLQSSSIVNRFACFNQFIPHEGANHKYSSNKKQEQNGTKCRVKAIRQIKADLRIEEKTVQH